MLVEGRFPRRPTRAVTLAHPTNPVAVGGGAPISVQSMTITKTADVDGTLAQIYALYAAGADIVRCTCNEHRGGRGAGPHRAPQPGADRRRHPPPTTCWRSPPSTPASPACASTPATSASPSTSRPSPPSAATGRCRSASASTAARSTPTSTTPSGGVTPEAMVESAQREMAYFDEVGFDLVKISVKASSVPLMIEAYRMLAEVTDHPLHLGVTEAGPAAGGPRQGDRRHRHAAGRGHRRHDPLQPHRRSRRGGQGRPRSCSSRWACASARASTSSPARRAAGPRST